MQKGKDMTFTLENNSIRDNIIFFAEKRGYDKETISEFLNFPEEGHVRDVTVFDIVKASIKLAARPSLFLKKQPSSSISPEYDISTEEFDKHYRKRHEDKENLFLSVLYPCKERQELLSFITSIREEEKIYNDIASPPDVITEKACKAMNDIWEDFSEEYRKIVNVLPYEGLDPSPLYGAYEAGESIICCIDVNVESFVRTAFFTGFDPISIMERNAYTLSDRDYFLAMFSDLPESCKESVWLYARYLINSRNHTETVTDESTAMSSPNDL